MTSARVRAWEQAARLAGYDPPPRVRPDMLHWLEYVVRGRLPERYSGWVLYDTTCGTWVVRHLLRLVAIVALPVAAIVVWLPADGEIRALTALTSGLCAVLFAGVYTNEAADDRLEKAGFTTAVGVRIRQARAEYGHRLANAARRERAAQRAARRR
jgi:hypothetical protein